MNNNKKKITTIVLLLAFLAIAVTGGTLAYFTDTKDATNTFVMGNVKIELCETFESANAMLIPGEANEINKDVQIKNIGVNKAYVWYEYLVPQNLDNADAIIIKNNVSGNWVYDATIGTAVTNGFVGTEEVGSVWYSKYVAFYTNPLANGALTEQGMDAVYLNSKVDYDETSNKYSINGVSIDHTSSNVDIIVRAYAIQADGLEDVAGTATGVDVYDAYLLYKQQNV